MKALARSYVFWPQMDQQIEDLGRTCSKCAATARLPPKVEPQPWPQPEKPWSRVHVDFAGPLNGIYYLILVDAYSKWPEVVMMRNTCATNTIRELRRIFSHHGVPEILVSDNGPQFTSSSFAEYCVTNAIIHIRTAPFYPQSNGQAERFVDTLKRSLRKGVMEASADELLERFLFDYRITPNPNAPEGKSPAECLMGRKLRSVFDAMLPNHPRTDTTGNHSHFSDRSKRRTFDAGDTIWALCHNNQQTSWVPAKILRRKGKVLYVISMDGRQVVRHINQLKPRYLTNEPNRDVSLDFNELLYSGTSKTTNMPQNSARNHRNRRAYPRRQRKLVEHFQVDPRRKSYVNRR